VRGRDKGELMTDLHCSLAADDGRGRGEGRGGGREGRETLDITGNEKGKIGARY
jgi:hypothetical protein